MSIKKKDVVYDDDTSDSEVEEEALHSFRAKLVAKTNTEQDDADVEETSDDDESGTDSTADENEEKKEQILKKAHISAKLSGLKNQLESLKKLNQESDEEDQSEAESDGKSDAKSDDKSDVESDVSERKRKVEHSDDEAIERKRIRSELSSMSIEEIQQLKEKIGLKVYNKVLGFDKKPKAAAPAAAKKADFKRENKNRPREMSSKKTVKRLRDVVGLKSDQKLDKRDPRFDNLCGDFDEKEFKQSYKFVDGIRVKEVQKLKEQLKGEDDPETIEKIKYLIQRSENQQREKAKVDKRKELDKEQKLRNKELAKEGKKPQFMGKRERQNIELVDKFEELKKSGKLENYIRKKNKKNLSKDRKRLKGALS